MAADLEARGLKAWAGMTSGFGGLALAQAWLPIGEDPNRLLTAEVRWHCGIKSGELRFGVDYFLEESVRARTEVLEMAKPMDGAIRVDSLREYLCRLRPDLDQLLNVSAAGHKPANEDAWLRVIQRGFRSKDNSLGVGGGRSQSNPGFAGDSTQRFEAVSRLDFSSSSAVDVVDLMVASLAYPSDRVPRQ